MCLGCQEFGHLLGAGTIVSHKLENFEGFDHIEEHIIISFILRIVIDYFVMVVRCLAVQELLQSHSERLLVTLRLLSGRFVF